MKNKKREKIFYGVGLLFVLITICTSIIVIKNPERFDMQPDHVITSESENISTVNLRVEKKSTLHGGMTGVFTRYYLVLSNDMVVYVTAKEFEEYAENQYYDFELVEKKIVTSQIRLKNKETE